MIVFKKKDRSKFAESEQKIFVGNAAYPDDMWEEHLLGKCDYYLIIEDGREVGFLAHNQGKMYRFIIYQQYIQVCDIRAIILRVKDELSISQYYAASYENSAIVSAFMLLATDIQLDYLFYKFARNTQVVWQDDYELKLLKTTEKLLQFYEEEQMLFEGIESYCRRLVETGLSYGLYEKDVLVGVFEIRKVADVLNMGIAIATRLRGKGLATMLISKAMEELQNEIVVAGTSADNAASQKTLKKAGFVNNNYVLKIFF